MPIYAKANGGGGNYAPATAGLHAAVCVDVIDEGWQENKFTGKDQHQIRIVWQIDEDRKDGKPFLVSKWYTLSLHEKANLRNDLESWRGKAFTEAELEIEFDVERLLGAPAYLNLIHKKEGSKYADVKAVMKLPKGLQAPTVRDYVRVCERDPKQSEPVANEPDVAMDLDEVPF